MCLPSECQKKHTDHETKSHFHKAKQHTRECSTNAVYIYRNATPNATNNNTKRCAKKRKVFQWHINKKYIACVETFLLFHIGIIRAKDETENGKKKMKYYAHHAQVHRQANEIHRCWSWSSGKSLYLYSIASYSPSRVQWLHHHTHRALWGFLNWLHVANGFSIRQATANGNANKSKEQSTSIARRTAPAPSAKLENGLYRASVYICDNRTANWMRRRRKKNPCTGWGKAECRANTYGRIIEMFVYKETGCSTN